MSSLTTKVETFRGHTTFGLPVDDSPELQALKDQAKELLDLPFDQKLEGITRLVTGAMENAYEAYCNSEKAAAVAQKTLSERSMGLPKLSMMEKIKRFREGIPPDAPSEGDSEEVKLVKERVREAREAHESAMKTTEKYKSLVFQTHPLSEALIERAGCCRYYTVLMLELGAAAKLGDRHYAESAQISGALSTCFNRIVSDGKTFVVSPFAESLKDKSLNYTQDPTIYQRPVLSDPRTDFFAYQVTESGDVERHVSPHQHFDR